MMAQSSMMVLMMLLTQGNGSDLLDYLHTQTYWKLQGVEVSIASMQAQLTEARDADVTRLVDALADPDAGKREAARAKVLALGERALPALYKAAEAAQGDAAKAGELQQTIGKILEQPKIGAVRRLMAIRTLGELKKPEAMDTLRGLLTSKAMFEADYARTAIAAITGKPSKRASLAAKVLSNDPWMLPADCGIVAQMTVPQGGGFDIDKALKDMGPMLGGHDPQQALQQITGMLLEATGRVGNIRIHSVTLGVANEIGPRKGFVVVLARGIYDAKAVKKLIAQESAGQVQTVDGVEVFSPAREIALMLPSDEMLVFVVSPGQQRPPRLTADGNVVPNAPQPIRAISPAAAAMAAAIKKGTGGLRSDGDIGKLIQAVDTTAPLWAVSKISDSYRQAGPVIQPFDTATLVGKPSKDGKEMELTMVARGTNADGVAGAVQIIEDGLQKAKQEVSQEAGRMPFLKTIADFLASVQIQRADKTVTMTARIKGAVPMMIFGAGVTNVRAMPMDRQEMPAQAQP
jgi:hypothetical protein